MSKSDQAIERACRFHEESVACRERSKFSQAESKAREALRIFEQQVGSEHPDVANVLSNLAWIHTDRAEYETAEPLYERAVSIVEKMMATSISIGCVSNAGMVWPRFIACRGGTLRLGPSSNGR